MEQANTLQAEMSAVKANLHKVFGWHTFAVRLSEYLRMSPPQIMEMPAMDVFGWYMVMDADIQMKTYNQNNANMNG